MARLKFNFQSAVKQLQVLHCQQFPQSKSSNPVWDTPNLPYQALGIHLSYMECPSRKLSTMKFFNCFLCVFFVSELNNTKHESKPCVNR